MSRRTVAVVIFALWAGGLAWMLRRNSGGDVDRRLTEAAIRIQPATFYYTLSYRGAKIGAAQSAIDTLVAGIVSEDYYTGRIPIGDSLEVVSARIRARLSRGFRLTDIATDVERNGRRSKMNGSVQGDTTLVVTEDSATHIIGLHGPLLTPSLIALVVLLGETPKVGLSGRFFVYNPMNGIPEWTPVRVAADSLFTVVDSAAQTGPGMWSAAHSDTARAWRLEGERKNLVIWVDAQGRIVNASAGGLSLTRTAFELAFDRAKKR